LAYDYHPNSVTLEKYHFTLHPTYISEEVLWSYTTQLASAIRAIHAAGLACRVVTLSKVILTSKNRVRISGVAIKDVVAYDSHTKLPHYQVHAKA
jgi:PAB-dependent poly(A)-specific ribonuclease subunit 3